MCQKYKSKFVQPHDSAILNTLWKCWSNFSFEYGKPSTEKECLLLDIVYFCFRTLYIFVWILFQGQAGHMGHAGHIDHMGHTWIINIT